MATLSQLTKLQGTVPGIYLLIKDNVVRLGFRPSTGGLGGRSNILDPRPFPNTPEGRSQAITYFKSLKTKYKAEIAKFPASRNFYMNEANRAYTKNKLQYSKDLVDDIDTLTKNPKYKTINQVEKSLFKTFSEPKYSVVSKGADPTNVFFDKSTKSFKIPREFEIYGGAYGKKKVREARVALRQIIGTKFFLNNPNYKNQATLLTNFYTDPEFRGNKKEIDLMRKFVKDFSITRSIRGDSIPARFFKDLEFDFSRKLKDVGKIFNTTEHLKELIANSNTSAADRTFYKTQLKSLVNDKNGILKALKEKFPNIFKKDAPGGYMQLEHRVARAIGETTGSKLPKSYIARASYVPGRFNQAKYYNYDKPLIDLVSEYNMADKAGKTAARIKIEKLTSEFNTRSGGYLEPLKFNWGNTVKITDATPLASTVKDADLLMSVNKSIDQGNKYFKSFGEETLKGMPKGKVATDFTVAGKEFGLFKKLVSAVKKSPSSCRALLDYQTGGISTTCSVALNKDPVGSAQKLATMEATGGALGKVKNAATTFLSVLGRGGVKAAPYAALAAVGAAAEPLVKKFMVDDPTTYLTDENQMKGMLLATIEGEPPKVDEEILKWQMPALGAATAAGAIPGAGEVYKARRGLPPTKDFIGPMKKGVGPTRAALGISGVLGKALGATFSPLAGAAMLPLHVAAQRKGGTDWGDIATDPAHWMTPAFAATGAEAAAKGIKNPLLLKALRLGMSPRTLRLISSRLGMPGLALTAGMWGYDKWKKARDD